MDDLLESLPGRVWARTKHAEKVNGDLWGQSTILEAVPINCPRFGKRHKRYKYAKLKKLWDELAYLSEVAVCNYTHNSSSTTLKTNIELDPVLEGYTDSDTVGYLDGWKFTSIMSLLLQGELCHDNQCVALSMMEAKYIAVVEPQKVMLWMKPLLQELGLR